MRSRSKSSRSRGGGTDTRFGGGAAGGGAAGSSRSRFFDVFRTRGTSGPFRRLMSRRCRAPRGKLSTVPLCLRHKRGPETGERGPAGALVKKGAQTLRGEYFKSNRGATAVPPGSRRRALDFPARLSRTSAASVVLARGKKSAQICRIRSC